MTKEELIRRNKKFVIEVLSLVKTLPSYRIHDSLVRQIVRSSTSVGANYRAACRAKSTADFINKLKIVEEEADETMYFLDLLLELDNGKNRDLITKLLDESNQLTAIYVSTIRTVRNKTKERKIENRIS